MAAAHTVTSAGGTTTGDVKRAFDFSVSDFATMVTTAAYVDKSLMIRDVYNASSRIMITAPPRFGKSTNLDMLKRFFEIEVDARGNPKPVHTTNNYKLFKNYNLEICRDDNIFKEHFGKHPVVNIDFKSLGCVDEAAKILDALKFIVKDSLNEHNYILQYSLKEHVFNGIAGFDENDFRKYVSDGITKDVNEVNLAISFNHLSTILNRVFGKKVYVLIDSYDTFLESPLFINNTDRKKLMPFVESSIVRLLNNVNCVDRVLITGVIPVMFEGFRCSKSNIECYQFLDSHPFTKYYGLTSAEVDTVLSKVIECDEERRDVRNTINDYYKAYETCNRDIDVYSVWSVLQYVARRTVQSYWCELRYINKFKKCFKDRVIQQKLQELLVNHTIHLHISRPLSMTDVLKVNSMITTDKPEHTSIEWELFFVLFYHFGYLSVVRGLGRGVVLVDIRSEEIKYEIAKAVFDENRELYRSPHMNGILQALDAFQPNATGVDQHCKTFHEKMNNWKSGSMFPFLEILEFLYVNLVTDAKYRRVMALTFQGLDSTAVLLENENKVAICIACDVRGQNAESAHQDVANYGDEEDNIFDVCNDVRGKVIITIGLVNEQIEIAYSYYFKTGDNLREVRPCCHTLLLGGASNVPRGVYLRRRRGLPPRLTTLPNTCTQ